MFEDCNFTFNIVGIINFLQKYCQIKMAYFRNNCDKLRSINNNIFLPEY